MQHWKGETADSIKLDTDPSPSNRFWKKLHGCLMDMLPSQLLHSSPSHLISAVPSLSALLASIPHLSLPFTPPPAGGPRDREHLEHPWKGNLRMQKVIYSSLLLHWLPLLDTAVTSAVLGVKSTELNQWVQSTEFQSNEVLRLSLEESKKLSEKYI